MVSISGSSVSCAPLPIAPPLAPSSGESGSMGTLFSSSASSSLSSVSSSASPPRRTEISSVSKEELQKLQAVGVTVPSGASIEDAGVLSLPAAALQDQQIVTILQKLDYLRHVEILSSKDDPWKTIDLRGLTQLTGLTLAGARCTKMDIYIREGVDISLREGHTICAKIKVHYIGEHTRSETLPGVFYETHSKIENYNGRRTFSDKLDYILCRHIAFIYLLEPEEPMKRHKKYENIASYRNAEIFGEGGMKMSHWSFVLEAQYRTFSVSAPENHIVSNKHWDDFCRHQLKEMEAELNKRSADRITRKFLTLSSDHAMVLRLGVKKKEGRTRYIISLFDPNLTTTDRRVMFDRIEAVTSVFENMLCKKYQKVYFGEEAENACTLFQRAPEPLTMEALKTAPSNRNITYHGDVPLSDTFLFHVMHVNLLYLKDCRRLVQQHIASIQETPDRLVSFLKAHSLNGTSGLYMALQDGHTESVHAYMDALLELTRMEGLKGEDLPTILLAKDHRGTSGLYMALQDGHTESVNAYMGALLELTRTGGLTAEDLPTILLAKDRRGTPGLHMALYNGHTESVNAYMGVLLELTQTGGLTAEDFPAILLAKNSQGIPGLHRALHEGHLATAVAYLEKSDGAEFTDLRIFHFRRTLYAMQNGGKGRLIYENPEKLKIYLTLLRLLRKKNMIHARKLQQILVSSSWFGHAPFFTFAQQNSTTNSADIFWKTLEEVGLGRKIPRGIQTQRASIVHLPSPAKPPLVTKKGTTIIPPPRREGALSHSTPSSRLSLHKDP